MASIINKSKTIVEFRCLNKLNKFINVHKDKNKPQVNNNVVYYGQTKRQLNTKLKKYMYNIR